MAKPLTAADLKGGNKTLTLNGKSFPVGPQTTAFKKPTGTGAINLNTPGLVFEGYDFRDRDLIVNADNVVIRNCLGDAAGLYTIWQQKLFKGLVVEYVMIDSTAGVEQDQKNENYVLSDNGFITIRNNIFLDSPVDCLNLTNGLIQNNVLIGAFYSAGAHADGISIHRTTGPIRILENYIDFRLHKQGEGTNSCVKIVGHFGNIADIVVDSNVLIGGGFNTYCGPAAPFNGTVTNVKITNNLMGMTEYGDKPEQYMMPGNHGTNISVTGNSLFSQAPDGVVSVSATPVPKPPETPPVVTPSDPSPIPAPVPTPTPVPGGKTLTADQVLAIKTALVSIAKTLE